MTTFADLWPSITRVQYFQRFTHRELIGSGAFGTVCKYQDLKMGGRIVALKEIEQKITEEHDESRSSWATDVIKEIATSALINHPNVVTVYELVRLDDGMFSIVMPFYPQTLKQILAVNREKGEFVSADYVRKTIVEILRALREAHQRSIIHRDIKPGNILVADTGEAVVADFGLARFFGDLDSSPLSQHAGTPEYMSPEQRTGKKGDQRTDIFSVGVVMYEMLNGQVTSSEPDSGHFIYNPSQSIDPILAGIVRTATHDNIAARFGSTEEMIGAIEESQQISTVTADLELRLEHYKDYKNRTSYVQESKESYSRKRQSSTLGELYIENFALPTNKPSRLDVKIYWDQTKIIELSRRDRPRDSRIALGFSFDELTTRYIKYKPLPLAEPPIHRIYASLESMRSQMSADVVLGWHGQPHGVPPVVWVEVIW